MRGTPESGFSRDMRRINLRVSASSFGRPTLPDRDFHRQNNLKPRRCHRITVSGCTMRRAVGQFGQIRDRIAQKMRSRFRKRGRGDFWCRAESCCRKARFSAASSARSRRRLRPIIKEYVNQPHFCLPDSSFMSGETYPRPHRRQLISPLLTTSTE